MSREWVLQSWGGANAPESDVSLFPHLNYNGKFSIHFEAMEKLRN